MIIGEDGMEMTLKKVDSFTAGDSVGGGESGSKIDKKIIGEWSTKEGDYEGSYIFGKDGYGSVTLDASSMICFKGNTAVIMNQEFGPEAYTFDGKTFSIDVNGSKFIEMKRITGSEKESFDGEYYLTGGLLYTTFEQSYANTDKFSPEVLVSGESLTFYLRNCFTYEAEDGKLTFIKGAQLMNNNDIEYTIIGKTMTFKAGGAVQTLTKKD